MGWERQESLNDWADLGFALLSECFHIVQCSLSMGKGKNVNISLLLLQSNNPSFEIPYILRDR